LYLPIFLKYLPNTAYNTPATTRKARIPIETPRPTVTAALNPGFGVGFEKEGDGEVVVAVVWLGTVVSVLAGAGIGVESETMEERMGLNVNPLLDVSGA
jgi:hypothetical protein